MSRILAIDYGRKRTGIAVTDPMQIIANGLTTVPTHELMDFLLKKKARQDKALVDEISATIILQSYLESRRM